MYVPSFWDHSEVFHQTDLCIIGSGIVGLNAALNYKLQRPGARVVVVDRGFLPYGASTRNAGFACYGSMTELLDDLNHESGDEVFSRVERRWKGLLRLRTIIGDSAMQYEPYGGFEVFAEKDRSEFEKCSAHISSFNQMLKNITGINGCYAVADERIAEFGLGGVEHLICNSGEGQIDTGRMMTALSAKVRDTGVILLNGVSINEINETGKSVVLSGENGFRLNCRNVLVANNGFAAQLLPQLQVEPARAQVLITQPVPGLRLKGSFHYDKGYYYFRNVNDRVLFGGGRNLDFEGERTVNFGLTDTIQNSLERLLKEMILPYADFKIDMRWSGIMGLGPSKSAIIQPISEHVFCSVRMGGMGVAIGSLVGEDAAKMILESE